MDASRSPKASRSTESAASSIVRGCGGGGASIETPGSSGEVAIEGVGGNVRPARGRPPCRVGATMPPASEGRWNRIEPHGVTQPSRSTKSSRPCHAKTAACEDRSRVGESGLRGHVPGTCTGYGVVHLKTIGPQLPSRIDRSAPSTRPSPLRSPISGETAPQIASIKPRSAPSTTSSRLKSPLA